MVAPIDAKSVLTVEGEDITLRLNFRSIALCEAVGLDLFTENGVAMTLAKSATLLKCLAANDHDLSDDEALAIVVKSKLGFGEAVLALMGQFTGEPEGNVKGAKA